MRRAFAIAANLQGFEAGRRVNERRGIQSIEVGLCILQALADANAPLTLSVIAKTAGVPSSSCHRYLTSFIKAGFVRREPNSSRYDLGTRLIHLGLAALRRADPVVVGLRACDDLAQATQRTAQLAIWSDDGPVIVSWRTGQIPLPTNLAVGSRLPLLNSATGRAFLSRLPRSIWEKLVLKEGGSLENAEQLAETARGRGYAAVEGDVVPGLSAIAAPILDARGNASAVVALLGLERQLTKRDAGALVSRVIAASAELGNAPEHPI